MPGEVRKRRVKGDIHAAPAPKTGNDSKSDDSEVVSVPSNERKGKASLPGPERAGVSRLGGLLPSLARKDALLIGGLISFSALVSVLVLWSVGALGPRVWANKNGSRVTMFSGTADEFSAALEAHRGEPVVVALYSTSCPMCSRMRAPYLECSRVFEDVSFFGVDAYESMSLAKTLDVAYVPHVVFLPDGSLDNIGKVYAGKTSLDGLRSFVESSLEVSRAQT